MNRPEARFCLPATLIVLLLTSAQATAQVPFEVIGLAEGDRVRPHPV